MVLNKKRLSEKCVKKKFTVLRRVKWGLTLLLRCAKFFNNQTTYSVCENNREYMEEPRTELYMVFKKFGTIWLNWTVFEYEISTTESSKMLVPERLMLDLRKDRTINEKQWCGKKVEKRNKCRN